MAYLWKKPKIEKETFLIELSASHVINHGGLSPDIIALCYAYLFYGFYFDRANPEFVWLRVRFTAINRAFSKDPYTL
jgi:hypothetical protein